MKKIRKAESLAAGAACKTKGSSGSLTEVSTDRAFGGPQITAEKDFSFKSSPAILYTTSK